MNFGKQRGFTSISTNRLRDIYNYYHKIEEWITICKNIRDNLTFMGPINIKWGDIVETGPLPKPERDWLVSKMICVLEYRDMFGFCPVRVSKKMHPQFSRFRDFIIPEFGSGTFEFRLTEKDTVEVKFNSHNRESQDEYSVFVWSGTSPDVETGEVRTIMLKLLKRWFYIHDAELNASDADYNMSHPTIFTQLRKEQMKDLDHAAEMEIYGDQDLNVLNAKDKRTYKRDELHTRRLERKLERMRQAGMNGEPKKVVSDKSNTVGLEERKRTWEDSIFQLLDDEEMAPGHIMPLYRRDIGPMWERYVEKVCISMGIPKSYASRARTESGISGLKGDVINENHLLKTAIEKNRQDVEVFFQYIYNVMFEKSDTEEIVRMLHQLDEMDIDQFSPQKVKYMKNKAIKIGKMRNRVELVFLDDPFSQYIPLSEVMNSISLNCVTDIEAVNILRKRINMPPIDEKSELIVQFNKAKIERYTGVGKRKEDKQEQVEQQEEPEQEEKEENKKRKKLEESET